MVRVANSAPIAVSVMSQRIISAERYPSYLNLVAYNILTSQHIDRVATAPNAEKYALQGRFRHVSSPLRGKPSFFNRTKRANFKRHVIAADKHIKQALDLIQTKLSQNDQLHTALVSILGDNSSVRNALITGDWQTKDGLVALRTTLEPKLQSLTGRDRRKVVQVLRLIRREEERINRFYQRTVTKFNRHIVQAHKYIQKADWIYNHYLSVHNGQVTADKRTQRNASEFFKKGEFMSTVFEDYTNSFLSSKRYLSLFQIERDSIIKYGD